MTGIRFTHCRQALVNRQMRATPCVRSYGVVKLPVALSRNVASGEKVVSPGL